MELGRRIIKYPIYIHKDEDSTYGAIVPDFPGCFTAADSLDDINIAAQEAIEVHCEGENMTLPAPSSIDALVADPNYQDGVWMLVDIDTIKVDSKAKRVNFTIRANLLSEFDEYVSSRGINRSAGIAMAIEQSLSTGRFKRRGKHRTRKEA